MISDRPGGVEESSWAYDWDSSPNTNKEEYTGW